MKKTILLASLISIGFAASAQSAEANSKEIMSSLPQIGFGKAIERLDESLKQYPDNYELLQDKVLVNYYNRNFSNVISLGKPLLERGDAQDMIFQLVGSAYNSIVQYKDAIKVLSKGVNKFPNSALLYENLGNAYLSDEKPKDAAATFEKGIQVDPNISGNYYSLAKIYATNGNPLWSVIYGEMFVNLESLTPRTKEIKILLFDQYKALFSSSTIIRKYISSGKPFEKAVATTLEKYTNILSDGVTTESLIALRGQFIVDWFQSDNYKTFPFRLFDRERQLLKQGNFEAYNQWLFSSSNEAAYNNWASLHQDDLNAFNAFHRSVIFKPLKGEYYSH